MWSTNASGGLIGKTEGFGTSSVTIGASFAMINTVSSSANSAGGLIGEATRAVNILNSYSKENDSAANGFVVAGANYAGGLIGLVNIPSDGDSLLITHSFSSVDVLSNKYSGGIAGAVIHSSPTASLNISTSFVAPAIINSLEDFQGGMFGKVDVNTNITDSFSSAKLTTASPGSYKTGLVASWISGDIAINGEVHWVKETGYNDFVPFAAWDFTTLPISKLSSDIGVSTVLQESNFTSLPTFFPISPWSNPAGFETPTFDTTVFNSATHSLTADLFFLDPTFGKPNN